MIQTKIFSMEQPIEVIDGSVTTPAGFRAAGIFCDIKRLGTGKGAAGDPRPGGVTLQGFLPCGQTALRCTPGLTPVG